MTCPPGTKPRMSATFGRPSLGADSALGDGEFEIELGDFTRSMSQVTLSAQPNASLILAAFAFCHEWIAYRHARYHLF